MESRESEVYLVSRSNCRVGRITSKRDVEEIKETKETDSKQ